MQKSVAYLYLRSQHRLFVFMAARLSTRLSQLLDNPRYAAKLVIDELLSDDTIQSLRMTLGASEDLLPEHAQNSLHVFISNRRLKIVLTSGIVLRMTCHVAVIIGHNSLQTSNIMKQIPANLFVPTCNFMTLMWRNVRWDVSVP